MTKKEIREEIESLSKNNEFYKRILKAINEQPVLLNFLSEQNFSNPLDLIFFLEHD